MNTQKIQTGTVGTKGFTLVELIVVITILVILGTIAFLNLGGMSASARDSQRTSDLNQINQQVMVQQAKSGLSYMSMFDGYASSVTTPSLAGATTTTGATTYGAGDVNYTVLGIDSAKFKDPISGDKYKMGSTALAGTAYELAASLEESKTALVMGSFRSRTIANSTTTSTVTASGVITLTAGLGSLKLNDIITATTSASGTGKVTAISSNLSQVTVDNSSIAGTNFALAVAESAGLIGEEGTLATAVVNGGTDLPYTQ